MRLALGENADELGAIGVRERAKCQPRRADYEELVGGVERHEQGYLYGDRARYYACAATNAERLVIKYLGSKRTLVPVIMEAIERASDRVGPIRSVIDLFSGTSRVGHALKRAGYRVLSNDHNAYAATLARCYVQADREDVARDAERLVQEFGGVSPSAGYFTETFCERARYVHPRNGARIDAIREAIARKSLEPELEAVMLVSLMEAADRVDSTTGVQMAYLKSWAPRAMKPLELRVPDVLPRAAAGKGEAHMLEACDAASLLTADAVYIDPPYNQHSYLGNYHMWESLVRWDKPEVYGVACKRVDVRDRTSEFNSRRRFREAMAGVLRSIRSKVLIVSFNNEGYVTREEMETMLQSTDNPVGVSRGVDAPSRLTRTLEVIETDYKRYVGAQIGIYNPQGDKVGRVGHLRNKELLYVLVNSLD